MKISYSKNNVRYFNLDLAHPTLLAVSPIVLAIATFWLLKFFESQEVTNAFLYLD